MTQNFGTGHIGTGRRLLRGIFGIPFLLLLMAVSIIGFLACEEVAGSREPSAIEYHERAAQLEAKVEEVRPYAERAARLPSCKDLVTYAAEREEVLDSALFTAMLVGENVSLREPYRILGEKLKLYDEMKADLMDCLRVKDTGAGA